ncbi:hypothetical protein, partial [Pseudomonas syringae group genomosp. 7]|uniref:hypothetical protein n=1 Tax=Pseudomonas syringae group genomosp. 7 TaxID=251699 RepID=UPI00376F7E61
MVVVFALLFVVGVVVGWVGFFVGVGGGVCFGGVGFGCFVGFVRGVGVWGFVGVVWGLVLGWVGGFVVV